MIIWLYHQTEGIVSCSRSVYQLELNLDFIFMFLLLSNPRKCLFAAKRSESAITALNSTTWSSITPWRKGEVNPPTLACWRTIPTPSDQQDQRRRKDSMALCRPTKKRRKVRKRGLRPVSMLMMTFWRTPICLVRLRITVIPKQDWRKLVSKVYASGKYIIRLH